MNVDKSVARMRTLQGENDGRPPRDGNSRTRLGLARTLLAATALVSFSQIASAQTVLPANAKTTCTVSAVEFADWFISGTVTVNGGVDPANSLTFPNMPNCSFYKWSEQMFLWLTSPVPAKYGGGTHVFDSPVFYDVSPPDPNDGFKRTLTPNTPGRIRIFNASIPQLGPAKKPVAFDKTGKIFTIVRPQAGPTGKPLIRDKAGQPVEIAKTQIAPNGKPIFLDKTGKAIEFRADRAGNPILLDRANKTIDFRVNKVLLNGKFFFLDANGNAIETEQGQADGNALIAQNGSLVYYALQVNDVYAYLATGIKNGGITGTNSKFPITPADLNKITAFGLAHSKTFPDANALAVELKSSWIEADGLPDIDKYVTMSARIPTFDKSNPMHWVQNGSKVEKLAMVGMHVVGSTAGHAEMIWATFEHVNNSRNAGFSYTNNANALVNVAQNNAGTWLFSKTPPLAAADQNQPLAAPSGADIVATTAAPIGPSDVLRVNPWGRPGNATSSNTEILSINNSVIGQLLAGDVRKNYIMTGSTWTIGGNAPSGGNQVGTNQMANTTMETFFQPSNCFSCHSTNQYPVSHIFNDLKPLFP
jgi:hypothetical protein